MSADGHNKEREVAPPLAIRPPGPAPLATAPLPDREVWAQLFVAWFFSLTGGDPEIDGEPAGHRWRLEYFECVRDPRAFEQYAENEIRAFAGGE